MTGVVLSDSAANTEEINQLVLANLGLARCVARRCRRVFGPVVDLEDLIQEATLGLLRAARYYRPQTNVRFSTYASRCCWHACVTMLKPILHPRGETESPPLVDVAGPVKDPLAGLICREIWAIGWPRLSPLQQEVLLLRYHEGLTFGAIGRRCGVGECRVRQIERRALSRLAGTRERVA